MSFDMRLMQVEFVLFDEFRFFLIGFYLGMNCLIDDVRKATKTILSR